MNWKKRLGLAMLVVPVLIALTRFVILDPREALAVLCALASMGYVILAGYLVVTK